MSADLGPVDSQTPPDWAQFLLERLVAPSHQENIPGDLLEEYRESVLPNRGRGRADAWYVAQVAGLLARAAWLWAFLVSAQLAVRTVADVMAPPTDWGPRSALSTWVAIATYLTTGFFSVYRTRRLSTGPIVALAAHVVGWALSFGVTAVTYWAVIRWDPRMVDVFLRTGGWNEEWSVPLMITPIVLALGTLGGLLGKATRSTWPTRPHAVR